MDLTATLPPVGLAVWHYLVIVGVMLVVGTIGMFVNVKKQHGIGYAKIGTAVGKGLLLLPITISLFIIDYHRNRNRKWWIKHVISLSLGLITFGMWQYSDPDEK